MWKIYSRFVLFIRSISEAINIYWSNSINRLYLLLIFILQLFLWWWSRSIYYQIADDLFIFHYTVDFGIDLVTPPNFIFSIPALALIFTIVNLILSLSMSHKKQVKLLWHLFGAGSMIINIFFVLALLAIYLINLA
jgi:hypothetical protein